MTPFGIGTAGFIQLISVVFVHIRTILHLLISSRRPRWQRDGGKNRVANLRGSLYKLGAASEKTAYPT